MHRIITLMAFAGALAAAGPCAAQPAASPAAAPAPWTLPSNEAIRQVLAERIDQKRLGVGMVVGVIGPEGRRIVAYGTFDPADPRPVDGRSLFEIGSMTKVFTSLLLADMVRRGEVALDDPISAYLPAGVKTPERGGRRITLVDLATHTSGLPRIPANFAPKDLANPYADYSPELLYAFLGSYALPRDIGAQYEYSNLGAGLLGHLLARRAGLDYPELVRRRITGPLGMSGTTVALTPELSGRLAPGHDNRLARVANWDLTALAGAGALRSDAEDMLTFLAAELGDLPSPLAGAMADQLKVRRPTTAANLQVALGWHVFTGPRGEVVWHDGGTGGYRSFMAFDPKARTGVVVLSNAFTLEGVNDIGLHVLTGAPLAQPGMGPAGRRAVAVEPSVLEGYVGRYQLTPQIVITVTRDAARLFAQLTGQPAVEVFPESRTDFFYTVVDAQLTFQAGPDGRATAVVLHQGGRDATAPRL